jgi:hypothetical protein
LPQCTHLQGTGWLLGCACMAAAAQEQKQQRWRWRRRRWRGKCIVILCTIPPPKRQRKSSGENQQAPWVQVATNRLLLAHSTLGFLRKAASTSSKCYIRSTSKQYGHIMTHWQPHHDILTATCVTVYAQRLRPYISAHSKSPYICWKKPSATAQPIATMTLSSHTPTA